MILKIAYFTMYLAEISEKSIRKASEYLLTPSIYALGDIFF